MNEERIKNGELKTIKEEQCFMEYDIVEATPPCDLIAEVKNQIEYGWRPLGGVAICEVESWILYAQAMVKITVDALIEHFSRADDFGRFGGAIVRRLLDGAEEIEMF